jgi:hypothetical protein
MAHSNVRLHFSITLEHMIILHSNFDGFVGIYNGPIEFGLTNSGSTYIGAWDSIVCASATLTNRGGESITLVTVDAAGSVAASQADVQFWLITGFMTGFASVGMTLFVRWLMRVFGRAARINTSE